MMGFVISSGSSGLSDTVLASLVPLFAIFGFFFAMVPVFAMRVALYGMPDYPRINQQTGWFVNKWFMNYFIWLSNPLPAFFSRHQISPMVLTWIAGLLSLASGFFYWQGNFGLAGWLMLFGGMFDIFDGHVARAIQRVTRSGGYLDSVMDRYAEFFVYAGLIGYYADRPGPLLLVLLAMTGAQMVSYTRAKAESLNIQCRVGGMQRHERILYLGVLSAASPILAVFVEQGVEKPVYHLTLLALLMIAVFANISAAWRSVVSMRLLDQEDGGPRR